jgi:hypothetical protein
MTERQQVNCQTEFFSTSSAKTSNVKFMKSKASTKQTWEYDPLCHTEVKLFIKDIHNLKHVQYKKFDVKSGML